MSETEHEQDDDGAADDDSHVPVSPPGESDADETEEAEEAAHAATEASSAQTEKEIENRTRALKREATAHANRISKIMGEDAQHLVPCTRCWAETPGFHWPYEVVPVDDEQRDAVLASMGMGSASEPPLREAEGVEMCPRCDGWGELRYPTRNVHMKTQQCPKCAGQGFVSVEQPAPPLPPVNAWQPTEPVMIWPPSNGGVPDQWGRPQGHPHYNVPPASVGV